jgi:hypothetical protein
MNQIEYEQYLIKRMLQVYCRRHHNSKNELCISCSELNDYAQLKLSKCKFGNEKPACKQCSVHCYKSDVRERMRQVMRFSGPLMPWYYPVDSIKHILRSWKRKV